MSIERIRAVEKDVEYLQEGFVELRDEMKAINAKMDEVISRLDAQANKLAGAGLLAKALWFGFPVASGLFGWMIGRAG